MLSGTGEKDRLNRKLCFRILSDLRVNRSLRARWGERFQFRSSQYARYMEARHDLGKFITELAVAERGAVLSSGRELLGPRYPVQKIALCGGTATSKWVRVTGKPDQRLETDRRIDNVGRLTPGAGIESSTRMGSDQTAAEALQEAETEVGVAVKVGRGTGLPAVQRSTDTAVDLGLTA
jgi:hypothetical protein